MENQDVFYIIEQIANQDSGRGHMNLTNFNGTDFKKLNEKIFEICEHITAYIDEFEEEKL